MDAINIRSLSGPKTRALRLAVVVIVLICTVLLLRPFAKTAQTAALPKQSLPGPEPEATPGPEPEAIPPPIEKIETVLDSPQLTQTTIDWSKFAYVQYATVVDYLCNSILIFASLNETDSKADRVLLYPESWSTDVGQKNLLVTKLLAIARDEYRVKLKPIKVQKKHGGDGTSSQPHTPLSLFGIDKC